MEVKRLAVSGNMPLYKLTPHLSGDKFLVVDVYGEGGERVQTLTQVQICKLLEEEESKKSLAQILKK